MDPRPFVPIKIDEKVFQALVDTGSTKTFIGEALRQELELIELPKREYKAVVKVANGSPVVTSEHYQMTLYLKEVAFTGEATYLPGLQEDAILGMDLLGSTGIQLFMDGWPITGRKAKAEEPTSTTTENEDSVPSSPGVQKHCTEERNRSRKLKDPFQGITLKGKHHNRVFTIYRLWGPISVRMNKKGDKASLKWRQMKKTINLPK